MIRTQTRLLQHYLFKKTIFKESTGQESSRNSCASSLDFKNLTWTSAPPPHLGQLLFESSMLLELWSSPVVRHFPFSGPGFQLMSVTSRRVGTNLLLDPPEDSPCLHQTTVLCASCARCIQEYLSFTILILCFTKSVELSRLCCDSFHEKIEQNKQHPFLSIHFLLRTKSESPVLGSHPVHISGLPFDQI